MADARGCLLGESPCPDRCDEDADRCDEAECPDVDGDGVTDAACGGTDCDDEDARRFPGNTEVCDADGRDEDCDPSTLGPDEDDDGYVSTACCNLGADGALRCGLDCNDGRGGVNPEAIDGCNGGVDDDCDGRVDEAPDGIYYRDNDGDGFGRSDESVMACSAPPGFAVVPGDCNDDFPNANPGVATDVCDGTLDNDCDGAVDEGCECAVGEPPRRCGVTDVGVCEFGEQSCIGGTLGPCSSVDPEGDEELCDDRDEDCDGDTDEGLLLDCFEDGDGDGFAASGAAIRALCACPSGTTRRTPSGLGDTDCNDGVPGINPDQIEVCDATGARRGLRWERRRDAPRGTASRTSIVMASLRPVPARPPGASATPTRRERAPSTRRHATATTGSDARSPVRSESCLTTGIDEDCDGAVDEGCSCTGMDIRPCSAAGAVGACGDALQTCMAGTFGPACPTTTGTEACGGEDLDCDGAVDENQECTTLDAARSTRRCTNGCGTPAQQSCTGSCTFGACTRIGRETCNYCADTPSAGLSEEVTLATATTRIDGPSSTTTYLGDGTAGLSGRANLSANNTATNRAFLSAVRTQEFQLGYGTLTVEAEVFTSCGGGLALAAGAVPQRGWGAYVINSRTDTTEPVLGTSASLGLPYRRDGIGGEHRWQARGSTEVLALRRLIFPGADVVLASESARRGGFGMPLGVLYGTLEGGSCSGTAVAQQTHVLRLEIRPDRPDTATDEFQACLFEVDDSGVGADNAVNGDTPFANASGCCVGLAQCGVRLQVGDYVYAGLSAATDPRGFYGLVDGELTVRQTGVCP